MRQWIAVVVCGAVLAPVGVWGLQSRTIPSRIYQADTRTFDIPPSAQKKFTGMRVSMTRETWPGASTVAVAAGQSDTQIILPVNAGVTFPLAGGRVRVKNPNGSVEFVQLVSRSGDVLTVQRGQENTAPMVLDVGAEVRLFDLVILQFQRTLDNGQSWEDYGCGATFSGGTILHPITGLPVTASSTGCSFSLNGQPVARDGDLRIVTTNRVDFRTSVTVELVETGDPQ